MNKINEEWLSIRSVLEQSAVLSNQRKIAVWLATGSLLPPPSAYKQELIKSYAGHYGYSVLVETGTYLGDMVEAARYTFSLIHSIELSQELYDSAVSRFKGTHHVVLHQGDSGKKLEAILRKLKHPAIFWLDAHYSAGVTAKGSLNTPIVRELELILNHKIKNHLILIDDSRIFNGKDDYPTVDKIKRLMRKHLKGYRLYDRNDIIRLQPDDAHVEI